jgi:hypothetical protein
VADEQPDQIAVPVVWVGVEETPIVYCNEAISQFDRDLETFIVTFGQLNPPALVSAGFSAGPRSA